MITLRRNTTDKCIELGGGANPHIRPNVDVRMCYDTAGNQTVDFVANFEEPLPIQSDEFDAVFSMFVIEHLSWRKVKGFISEVFRITKPGGKIAIITANTEAQMKYVLAQQDWNDNCSCILFGDQDYLENAHKNAFSPKYASKLFQDAGFIDIVIQPYGELATDMAIEAIKPKDNNQVKVEGQVIGVSTTNASDSSSKIIYNLQVIKDIPREQLFDKYYFNGGKKVGGYANEGYWDFPNNYVVAQKILAEKPESVLELGASRGYVLKRLQDAGVRSCGLEISRHCWMTRVCDGIIEKDVCEFPWPYKDQEFDLTFSNSLLECIPTEFLERVVGEMARVSKRTFHGIDFGNSYDGFDKTKISFMDQKSWDNLFADYFPYGKYKILDKEELSKGEYPQSFFDGDGKVKLNIGSFITMFHNGWTNIDIHDLNNFANHYRYKFQQLDVKTGLPYQTQSVDLIYTAHMLEHLNYDEGLNFLRECRRVLKPEGIIRIIVPDADLLHGYYDSDRLDMFDHINDGCENSGNKTRKLWELLHAGHAAAYDDELLDEKLKEARFYIYDMANFRQSKSQQMLAETLDVLPCLSLYTEGLCRRY